MKFFIQTSNAEYLIFSEQKHAAFLAQSFVRNFKTGIYVPRKPFWKNFLRKMMYFCNGGFQNFLTCTKKFPGLPWRLHTCQVDPFGEQIFGRNQNFRHFALGVQNYWIAKRSNICGRVGKTAIHVPRETIWGKWIFLPKNLILNVFSEFERRNSGLLAQIFTGVVKAVSYASKNPIEKFSGIGFFFGILEKTFIWTKKLQVCQEGFLTLQGNNFLGETTLSHLSSSDWKLNGCLRKHGWQICQKRIPRDQRIRLRNMKLLSKNKKGLWIHFLTYSEKRSFFWRNNSPVTSKLKPTCPETNLKKVPE